MINNNIEINIKKIVLFDNNNDNDASDYKEVIEDFQSQLTDLIEKNGIDKFSFDIFNYDNEFSRNKVNKEISKFSANDLAQIVFDKIINSYSIDKGK
jgi:hypothetical protein